MLDISKCFDSIYTHSLSWGLKNKDFSKSTKGKSTFANHFDEVMQKSNYNETNGIPIGSEFSRVFSELLLNGVDLDAIARLERQDINFDVDYTIKRYVDDYFLFSKNENILKEIYGVLQDTLGEYKLSINTLKTKKVQRPFFTSKSSAMMKLSEIINEFSKKFTRLRFEILEDLKIDLNSVKPLSKETVTPLYPININKQNRLIADFIHRVQALCNDYELGYEEISHYIISSFFKRAVELIEGFNDKYIEIAETKFRVAFEVIVEISFYFYCLAPTVSGSFALSKLMVLTARFFKKEMPGHSNSINQFIYAQSVSMLKLAYFDKPMYVEKHLSLEKINILLATIELGKDLKLPSGFIKKHLLNDKEELSYYEIIALLYYIKNESEYFELYKILIKSIKRSLCDIKQVNYVSEKCHIFLDVVSCPYISIDLRKKLLKRYRAKNGLRSLTGDEISVEATYFENNYWFVNWTNLDIYNVIEKKVLQFGY